MAEVTVPMDDKELFNAAMADEVVDDEGAHAAEIEAKAPPEPEGQPRDEQGRFAPKTEEATQADAAPTQQQPEAVSEGKEEGNVPSWRLREIREERDALARQAEEVRQQAMTWQRQAADMQRQLAELQKPKQEPVDFYVDPQAAFKQNLSPFEERMGRLESELRMGISRVNAITSHGKDLVSEAEAAVATAMRNNDPSLQPLAATLRVTNDPVGAAVEWYSSQKLMKETGGNIAAYRDKILADAMKDPAFQAKVLEAARTTATGNAGSGSSPNIKLPPSLNKTAGSGGGTTSELDAEDMSDRALFRHAMGGR